MDRGEDAQHPAVLIVHHPDGTADVNGVPVRVRPGQDVREAAYLTAVALVSSLPGAGGGAPVAATRVEPDGTRYPLMLYPGRTPFTADLSSTRTQPTRMAQTLNGLASLRLRWLVPIACGCVLLTALATVLLHTSDTGLAQSTVNSRVTELTSGPKGASGAQGIGAGLAGRTSAPQPAADPTKKPVHASPTSSAHPAAAASPTQRQVSTSTAVGYVALALFGGDHDDPEVSYVITVTADNTDPITLTYVYSGSKAPGGTRTQVLSGQLQYALAGSLPGKSFCGGTVTMQVSTRPQASNGTVTATTMQAC